MTSGPVSPGAGRVIAELGLRLRAGPSIDAPILGTMANGTAVFVESDQDGWSSIRLCNPFGVRIGRAFSASQWIALDSSVRPPDPAPAPISPPAPGPTAAPASLDRRHVGVHLITNRGAAQSAYDAGARLLMFLGNKLEAVQFKMGHPDAIVVYRAWISNAWPTPEQMVSHLGPSPSDPPIVFVGLNENDSAGSDPAAIRARAKWDAEVAGRIKAIQPNAIYLGGSFAHGTPDITNSDVLQALREAYAPLYNAGLMGFDMHNYTKGWIGQIAPIWFERRWEWLFTHAGFDPRIRNIWSTETGVEAGSGGFGWGISNGKLPADALTQWLYYHDNVQRAPLVVEGASYMSPYIAGAIFTHQGYSWEGYWIPIEQAVGYWRGDPDPNRARGVSQ